MKINNSSAQNVAKEEEIFVDLLKLTSLIEDLRAKVGDVRDGDRYQLAHKIGVSASALCKFQTPQQTSTFELLEALIAYYYPGKMLAPDGGLQDYSHKAVEYWIKLTKSDKDDGMEYL